MTIWWNPREAEEWSATLEEVPLATLMARAKAATLAGHGTVVTYSRKVFIPLTQLCRDVCHYCTFAQRPSQLASSYLDLDKVLAIARAGAAAGCREALFTLGDRPEARYPAARAWLDAHGYASTLDYVAAAAGAVLRETGLLPHLNPGLMDAADYAALRPLSGSMGLMLESASDRLCDKGGAHHGSPDKRPAARLEAIALAGVARVPFTTGLLIGIGETRLERIEALLAIRELHVRHGHIQEVIVQNFRAKPGTRMAAAPEPSLDEHLWTIAAARLILGPAMTIQAPPNLRPGVLTQLVRAGVNDWGGVSPVTPDHVNPEAPWPHLDKLESETGAAGRHLRQRLAIGPAFAREVTRWADPALQPAIRRAVDGRGLVREGDWHPGRGDTAPTLAPSLVTGRDPQIVAALGLAERGQHLDNAEIARLFTAEGRDFDAVCTFADDLRRERVGDTVIRARSWANNASGAGVENCCRETCNSLRTVCVGSELHKVSNASRHGGPGISLRCNRSATAHSSISKAARIGTSAPFDVFEVFFRCVSKDARDVIVSRAGSSVIAAVARKSWCMGISINSD